jgi:hypothetical protein
VPRSPSTRRFALALLATLLVGGRARADGRGFALDRYQPTPAGEWFFAVEQPRYANTRWFAGGITLDYGNKPLVAGTRSADGSTFVETSTVIAHQLVWHVDLAGSFIDRIMVSASLPVVLYEGGTATPIAGVSPSGAVVGDPRIGFMIRLFGRPERDRISLHFGGYVWFPVGTNGSLAGDPDVRILPRLVAAGTWRWLTWSANVSFLARMPASLGAGDPADGNSIGHELQLAFGAQWVDGRRRFHVGPEVQLGTVVAHAFTRDYTSLELLGSAQYLIGGQVMVGLAAGGGLLREPGTPYARFLARVTYAPLRRPRKLPPPPPRREREGVPDRTDAGRAPPTAAPAVTRDQGLPLRAPDRDGDGVDDAHDLCPEVPAGAHPEPTRPGCPAVDSDGDGIFDYQDLCPVVPMGAHPDPDRPGCPAVDSDGDGVPDRDDRCPFQPAGAHPDPARPGCPGEGGVAKP